uniref:C2H2-type domain-containing protein n=1 Tax=Glossina brevipalpis TaxID=37001 RepID=A0A1A9WXA3_9MUSC
MFQVPKMDDPGDLEDTHLCIKCRQTIVGLENYIQHRKQNCRNCTNSARRSEEAKLSTANTSSNEEQRTAVTTSITYEDFHFTEPEPPTRYGGKSTEAKTLTENYELPCELGADVFFSSLQLQSVQSSVSSHHLSSTAIGKTTNNNVAGQLQRQKPLQSNVQVEESWIVSSHTTNNNQQDSENLLNAINDIGEPKKSFETLFKPISFEHDSPELSEDEEEDDAEVDIDDDDDEDYDPMVEAHAAGGKWKLTSPLRHSPPVVPVSHTGGKWKPEHRPNLRVAHSQLTRLSPNWDDQLDDVDGNEGQHPPSHHTKGKWIPGTKLQRLEYKEDVELRKTSKNQEYWCNICCRKLKSKNIYENHLKTSYHIKRAEPEQQLEKAVIEELPLADLTKTFISQGHKADLYQTLTIQQHKCHQRQKLKKRRRRSTYLKCSLCKHTMSRHLIGKHLISHYHYRRMQMFPEFSIPMILDNIHSVVLQSPFQCRPCRFYANTEETFLMHWNSSLHRDSSEGPGQFWCSYCRFECEDNNQMRRHLLGPEHQEVILAINRSVPICISKRLSLDCSKCGQQFRYNFKLRNHILTVHSGTELTGSVADDYQTRFKCDICSEVLRSQIALQRHEKFKHSISKYFCSICNLEFNSPCKARRHRKSAEHKRNSSAAVGQKNKTVMAETKLEKFVSRKEEKSETLITASEDITRNKSESKIPKMNEMNEEDSREEELPCTSREAKVRGEIEMSTKQKKMQKCKDCTYVCNNKEELRIHRKENHSLLMHNCMSCGDNFLTPQALGRHTRKCTPPKLREEKNITSVENPKQQQRETWSCDECNFVAAFKSELLYHRLYHTYGVMGKNQIIKCPLCEKTFRKHSLRCHLRQHTNEKIFKCDFCSLQYSRRHNLKDHVNKFHANDSKQSKDSEQALKTPSQLTYKCDNCDKIYKSK